MKNEKDVKKEIKKVLIKVGAWYYMPVQTGYGAQGIPDFIVCYKGHFIGIEAKFGGRKETAWQKKQGEGIKQARGLYLVIDEATVSTLAAVLALV